MNIRNSFDSDVRAEQYDRFLDRIGLQRKGAQSNTWAAVGLFAMGVGLGATLGMLFAPKQGSELRQQAREKLPGTKRSNISGQERIYQQTTASRPNV